MGEGVSRDIIMKRIRVPGGLLRAAVVFGIVASASLATSIVKRTFNEVCHRADLIFVGTATAIESTDENGVIRTYTRFENIEWISGGVHDQDHCTVRTLGGRTDTEVLRVHGMPEFAVGERYVLFLDTSDDRACPVVGWHQGCFRIVEEDGLECVEDYRGRRILSISAQDTITESTAGSRAGRVAPMPLQRFVDTVKQRIQANETEGTESP